jgi:CheY-like chemotaxis protein
MTSLDQDTSLRSASRPRVLVVDDHAISVTLLSLMLERFGLAPVGAGSVAEARARMTEGSYALIMIDALLGEDSGLDLARELAAATSAAIVIASGLEPPDRLPAGVFGWLAKPYSPRSVFNIIRQAGAIGIGVPDQASGALLA